MAAATTATVLGVSAGVALAATGSPAGPDAAPGHAAAQISLPSTGSGAGHAKQHKVEVRRSAGQGSAHAGSPSPATRPQPPATRKKVTDHSAAASGHAHAYLIYDSVVPQTIPANQVVATYADGAHPPPVSSVAGRKHVLWIDVIGSDPSADVVDVEPGCATPAVAASWVSRKLTADPKAMALIYTMLSEWPAVKSAVAGLPGWMQARIRWWIANPTGSPHLVPGSDATQWYWGSSYDISTATARF